MVLSSFKANVQVTAYPPVWVFRPTLQNYVDVFTRNPFFTYMLNSTVIALAAVGIGLLFGLPAAYTLARHRQTALGFLVLTVRILPGIAFLVPLFVIYRQLGLINTHAGIVLTHIIVVLPLIIWIMAGFFEDVPRELEEAAMIDGCSRVGTFLRIVLPLGRPGIVAATILSFIASWNNFIFVLILGGRGHDHAAHGGLQLRVLRGRQLGRPHRRRHGHHPAHPGSGPGRPALPDTGPHDGGHSRLT